MSLVSKDQVEIFINYVKKLPIGTFHLNRDLHIFAASAVAARLFAYESTEQMAIALQDENFWARHFEEQSAAVILKILNDGGSVENFSAKAVTLNGQITELTLAIISSTTESGNQVFNFYFFDAAEGCRPGSFAALLQQNIERIKSEFLSNISHELRTPLNIIIGMLDLVLSEGTLDECSRENLGFAQESAHSLINMITDLITISYLEADKQEVEKSVFSLSLLVENLLRTFYRQLTAKKITVLKDLGPHEHHLLEGGYTFIIQALEKVMDNAIKFSETGAVISLCTSLENIGAATVIKCGLKDNGPGINFAEPKLFVQGDSSKTREYGGLGLGLKLTQRLAAKLKGEFKIDNHPTGGVYVTLTIPVELAPNK